MVEIVLAACLCSFMIGFLCGMLYTYHVIKPPLPPINLWPDDPEWREKVKEYKENMVKLLKKLEALNEK